MAFQSGKSTLSDEVERALQNAVKLPADNPASTADSIGHTDDGGAARYNVSLSCRREEAIRRFPVERGVDLHRIAFIGLGEEQASGKDVSGRAQDRRGTIRVDRPAE